MRRVVLEDPFARSSIWSRNLAVFALVVAALGIVLARRGLDPKAALAIELGALGFAAVAILCAVVALAVIWHTGYRGVGLAAMGAALSLGLFAYPAYVAVEARTGPMLTDVTTDVTDPPGFLATQKALAARDGTTPSPSTPDARALQLKRAPDIESLSFDAEALDVAKAIRKLVRRHRWTIADESDPTPFATGHVDVVIKPAVMGFPVDLTFRVKSLGTRTVVDIRSVARAGWQEQPGSNVARVQMLANELDGELGAG